MTQKHIHQQIPDYVLGLLPRSEQMQVEQHSLVCHDCHLALRQETDLGKLVKSTLTAASLPPANLRQFMPTAPAKTSFWPQFSLSWQHALMPLTLVLFMLLGSLGFYLLQQQNKVTTPGPTALAVTATLTDSPTATITETPAEQAMISPATAVPVIPLLPAINATPAPNPTPIAALNIMRDT